MEGVPKFIIAVLFVGAATIAVSFLWPRFTSRLRPSALTKVHEIVYGTPVGPQIAQILGVSDEKSVEPISIKGIAQEAVNGAVHSVGKYTANVLFLQAARGLAKQFQELTPDEQKEVRQLICSPPEHTTGVPAP